MTWESWWTCLRNWMRNKHQKERNVGSPGSAKHDKTDQVETYTGTEESDEELVWDHSLDLYWSSGHAMGVRGHNDKVDGQGGHGNNEKNSILPMFPQELSWIRKVPNNLYHTAVTQFITHTNQEVSKVQEKIKASPTRNMDS